MKTEEFYKIITRLSEPKEFYVPIMNVNYNIDFKKIKEVIHHNCKINCKYCGGTNFIKSVKTGKNIKCPKLIKLKTPITKLIADITCDIKFTTEKIKTSSIIINSIYNRNGEVYSILSKNINGHYEFCDYISKLPCTIFRLVSDDPYLNIKENLVVHRIGGMLLLNESLQDNKKQCDYVVERYNNTILLIKCLENENFNDIKQDYTIDCSNDLSDYGLKLLGNHLTKIILEPHYGNNFKPFFINLSIQSRDDKYHLLLCVFKHNLDGKISIFYENVLPPLTDQFYIFLSEYDIDVDFLVSVQDHLDNVYTTAIASDSLLHEHI